MTVSRKDRKDRKGQVRLLNEPNEVNNVKDVKCELYHDNFQNFKSYNIPKAQLVLVDIPYNVGTDFYASRPDWYVDGDNSNLSSILATTSSRLVAEILSSLPAAT